MAPAGDRCRRTNPMRTKFLPVLALIAGLSSSAATGFAQDKASLFDSVQAILAENCLSCHGAAQMSDLDLRQRESFLKGGSRGPSLVPGKAEDSLLFQAAAHIGELQMPPESPRLPKEEAGPHPPMDRLGRRLGRQQQRRRHGPGGTRLVVVPQAAAAHLATGGR